MWCYIVQFYRVAIAQLLEIDNDTISTVIPFLFISKEQPT